MASDIGRLLGACPSSGRVSYRSASGHVSFLPEIYHLPSIYLSISPVRVCWVGRFAERTRTGSAPTRRALLRLPTVDPAPAEQ